METYSYMVSTLRVGINMNGKLDNHQEVIDLIKWAKDNNCTLRNMNIADFVISKMWRSVKELKEGDGVMQFDSTKEI